MKRELTKRQFHRTTYVLAIAVLLWVAHSSVAAPIVPLIADHDFQFGAEFQYSTNGSAPDTLSTAPFDPGGGEVTALWSPWPAGPPVEVWFDDGIANGIAIFGADLRLNVSLSGHDEVPPHLTVSLTGTGANTAGPDLEIWGNLLGGDAPNVKLWAIELEEVVLYGYGDSDSYVLEGEGTIVDGEYALANNLIGTPGAMRGNIDFLNRPAGFMPDSYDPLKTSPFDDLVLDGGYSGETGLVPEPATVGLLGLGVLLLLLRRRRRRA